MDGRPSWGAVRDGRIADLGDVFPTLRDAIAAQALNSLPARAPTLRLVDVTLLPPIPEPRHIFCIGFNYRATADAPRDKEPKHPNGFTRWNHTIVGHNQPIWLPRASSHYDYEGELALIVGTGGRFIPRGRALAALAGYCTFNDGSVRDFQEHSVSAGKNFPCSAAAGPWMVTTDEVGDPADLRIVTRVNGEVRQDGPTSNMIFDVPAIIEYLSQFVPLGPGDVIATGSPPGAGFRRSPQVWLNAGDRVEINIDRVGTLTNTVAPEPA